MAHKSLKNYLEFTSSPEMAKAVFEQICGNQKDGFSKIYDNPEDYFNASVGISGFIYYKDTCKFAYENRDEILDLIDNICKEMGVNIFELVSGFGVFRNDGFSDEDQQDLTLYMRGKECENVTIPNVMAWLAVEHIAHDVEIFKQH